jgi:hypothetical protein
MRSLLTAAFVLAMIPACSHSTAPPRAPGATPAAAAVRKADAKPAAKPAARVAVIDAKSTKRKSELVGVIDVAGDKGHRDAALEAMRVKAAAMGADAIVGVEYHEGTNEPGHYSGVAVRYKKHHHGTGAKASAKTLEAPKK